MFARQNLRSTSKSYSNLGGLAAFVMSPNKVATEESLSTTQATTTTAESTSEPNARTIEFARSLKTGDHNSFWCSANDNVYVDKRSSKKGYRVLSYRKSRSGKRIVFDILDGKPYYCGSGLQRRITNNVVVFDSRQAALSERFPSNQVISHSIVILMRNINA